MEHKLEEERLSPTYNIIYLLRIYSLNFNTYEISYPELLAFIKRCLDRDDQNEVIREYAYHTEQRLIEDLELLSYEKNCSLQYMEGKISRIYFPRFFLDKIYREYKRLETDMELAFPTDDVLKTVIPQHLVTVINVKTDFIKILSTRSQGSPRIIRLLFPDLINPIIITSDILAGKLLDYAVMKIRMYMEKKRNSSYIENKIFPIFRQKGRSLKEMITNIILRTSQTIATIREPTDFSFRFWAHFANLIIQEYRQKSELLPTEHDFCQAAYLIGLYNVFYKSVQQREREKISALKQFEKQLRRPPFVFTLTDIHNFKDSNGYLLLNKYSREFLNKIIDEKVQPPDATSLPELVRFITSNGQDYYIHKSSIMVFCLRKIFDVSQQLRKFYINQWIELLKEHKKTIIMSDEIQFIRALSEKVQINFPVLAALLNNYNLLYLANEEFPLKGTSTSHIFDRTSKSLQPINILLGLDRQEMLEEARSFLPFWQTIPVIRWIVAFLKKLFLGNKKNSHKEKEDINKRIEARYSNQFALKDYDERAGGSALTGDRGVSDKTDPSLVPKLRANYRRAIMSLQDHFVGEHDTLRSKLEFLADKWNPLFDHVAKANLVEDVNAMIRDFLRTLKRGFRVKPPTIHRIETLAATLARNKHFDEIKKKHYLRSYIEVYMIKVLGENRF